MSHSRIFDEYAKIMSERGLLKTADKKDNSYNTIPDKAGPDTKVDETGYELTEIAHADQIQIAESRLNDGIFENDVERQKVMIDVALRNPRGVLAALMKTLVKTANVLEEEMSEESLKMAVEVDSLLKKLAREAMRSEDVMPLVEEVLNRFGSLDFTILGFGERKKEKEIIYKTSLVLKKFLAGAKTAGPEMLNVVQNLAAFVKGAHNAVLAALGNTRDWGNDADEAREAWDNLKMTTDAWYQEPTKTEQRPEQQTPGVAAKAPGHSVHRYSVASPEVKELQRLLSVEVDGKFGKDTFTALKQKATENSLLAELLKDNPKLAQGYQGWDNSSVGEAILRIKQAQGKPAPKKDEILNPYPEGYEVGYQAGKRSPQPDIEE